MWDYTFAICLPTLLLYAKQATILTIFITSILCKHVLSWNQWNQFYQVLVRDSMFVLLKIDQFYLSFPGIVGGFPQIFQISNKKYPANSSSHPMIFREILALLESYSPTELTTGPPPAPLHGIQHDLPHSVHLTITKSVNPNHWPCKVPFFNVRIPSSPHQLWVSSQTPII